LPLRHAFSSRSVSSVSRGAKLSHAQLMNYVLQQIITVQPYYWSKSYLEIKILRIMLLPVSLPSGKWKSDHYNASWSEN